MILLIIAFVFGALLEGHAPSWGYDPGLYRHCASSTGKPGDESYWADRPDCNGEEPGWLVVINSERAGSPGVSCPGPLNRSYAPGRPASFRWSRERDFSYQVEIEVDRRGFSDECGDMWTFAALYDRLERGSRFPEPSRLVTSYRLSFERVGAARIILGASFATDTKRLIIEINLEQDIPGMPLPDSEASSPASATGTATGAPSSSSWTARRSESRTPAIFTGDDCSSWRASQSCRTGCSRSTSASRRRPAWPS